MKEFYVNEFKKCLPFIISSQNPNGFFGPSNNARWQEAILALLLWDKEKFKDRILDGIKAWSRLQNKNGSFSENGKESYAATAFSLYAVSRCLNELNERKFLKNLEKACEYLSSYSRNEVTNQDACAGLALIEVSNILGNCKEEGIEKIKSVIKNQSKEGWFPEYYGPDIGYGSLTLELLGLVYLKNVLKKEIVNSAKKFIEWVEYFIFPDGSIGGSYNTRTCGWLVLDGFEIFKRKFPVAERIIKKHIRGQKKGIFDATHLIDKRHLMTDSWRLLSAYKNFSRIESKEKLPCEKVEFTIFFEESKIYVFKKISCMGIISANEYSRCGLTLWKPKRLLIDLNKRYPRMYETKIKINSDNIEVTGYPIVFEELTKKAKLCKLSEIYKGLLKRVITKHRIIYTIKEDSVVIDSNRPLIVSGFGIDGKNEKIRMRDNIFFRKEHFKTKRGNFFEM